MARFCTVLGTLSLLALKQPAYAQMPVCTAVITKVCNGADGARGTWEDGKPGGSLRGNGGNGGSGGPGQNGGKRGAAGGYSATLAVAPLGPVAPAALVARLVVMAVPVAWAGTMIL